MDRLKVDKGGWVVDGVRREEKEGSRNNSKLGGRGDGPPFVLDLG